jgi:hypothetical protein
MGHHNVIGPGDDARAADRVVDLLVKYAVRFDPVDRITFFSNTVHQLASMRVELEVQMRKDDVED